METILYTKRNGFEVKTTYDRISRKFSVFFVYMDGTEQKVEDYINTSKILETHEYWCKFAGLLKSSFNASQVEKHLTSIA